MSTPQVPIVWAKLQPPMLPEQVVVRDAVLEQLMVVADPALTAIVAPAGYGKTTTALQLVERIGDPVAWLALESADNDPVRFWTYVSAALGTAGVDGLDEVYELLSRGPSVIEAALTQLRSSVEKDGRNLLLVLDDFQVIERVELEQQLSELFRNPVANLHVICTSRRDLPLPVGRLRSQGRLTEVRIDRLAFSRDELEAVLDGTFGLSAMSETNLAALMDRTEGWPVGVYLAGLGLQNDADVDAFVERFTGDTRHLTEYLSAEAVDDLDQDLRAFLLSTSLVSTLVPDLCDELTGRPGSLGVLRSLVRDNIFTVSLNAERTLFRYHPLFQEHLRSTLAAEHIELVPELERRASHWYERNGDIDQAIVHASASGDTDRAKALIESTWLLFSRAGQFGRLEQWITLLGDAATTDTRIALMMNWVLLNERRYDELGHWEELGLRAAATDVDRELLAVEAPSLRSHVYRHQGDIGAALEVARAALAAADLDRRPTPGRPVERIDAVAGSALVTSGTAEYWAGDLAVARDLLSSAVTHARGTGELSSVVMGYTYLAMVEVDAGNDELALAHADQVLGLVDEATERFHLPAVAHLARSVVLLRMGRPADAEAALAEARRIDDLSDEPLVSASIELQEARLRHLLGDQEGARAALRSAKSIVEPLPDARFDERIRATENEIRFVAVEAATDDMAGGELSDRERAVVALLPHGLSRRDLASQLHVSENTLKTHLTSIRHKLGVRGRDSIVDRAVELGLLNGDVDGAGISS